jgi:hypothetical protein
MKAKLFFVALLFPHWAHADDCRGARYIDFNDIINNKTIFVGRVFQTKVLLRTDGIEHVLATSGENAKIGMQVEFHTDNNGKKDPHESADKRLDMAYDFFKKEGVNHENFEQKMSKLPKIVNYRQQNLICATIGRVQNGIYSVVVYERIFMKSYITELP